jgi:hypothetical protein
MQIDISSSNPISIDNARSGVTGHNVRYVLGFGMLSAVLSLAIVGLFA